MNKSNTIAKLAEALAKAQAEMPHVPMNSVNPFLKNKFADLGAVITTVKPILAKYGLSYSQLPVSDTNRVGITTIVMHTSGEWIESTVTLELADEKGKSAAQVAGSIITYLRRYSLSAAFGLYADEDTDGNKPEPKPEKSEAEKKNDAIKIFKDLVARGKMVKVEVAPLEDGWTLEKMREHYKEQLDFVKQAESQEVK